jgi:flagellar protein FliO/FliZ
LKVLKTIAGIICVLFLLSPSITFAASEPSVSDCLENKEKCGETAQTTKDSQNQSESSHDFVSAWDYVKVVIAFIFVIALLYGVLKFVNKRNHGLQAHKLVQNLGGTTLGNNRSVQVVKVGERVLVVGVGQNVELLTQITDNEEREKLLREYNELGSSETYKTLLPTFLEKRKRTQKDFKTEFQSRLQEMKNERSELLNKMERKNGDDE